MAEFITCNITKAISKTCKNRQGGISKLYLFPYVKHSKSLNLTIDQEVVTFPFTNAFLYEAQNIVFTESTSIQNGGIEWTQKLDFTIPEADENSEVYKLANKDYSAVVLDRNGKYRFIGMRNGGEVTVNAVSGTLRSDMNGFNISLNAKEDNQAYYIPTFETIFNVVTPLEFILPSAPSNLVYSNFYGGDSIDLDWDASTQGTFPIVGYYIYNNNSLFATVQSNSINISNLNPSNSYSFYIRAFDTKGNYGSPTNKINVSTVSGDYPFRVASDGGVVESIECINEKIN
jgi:hypothetical protein